MSDGDSTLAGWPADIIHVNEDGWVLINRGRRHGVAPGLRLLVVGQGIRELRDLFAGDIAENELPPLALRIRRTYEELEVIHAEDAAAIAIATRTPPERRPHVYTGPEGELLVWAPLPPGFTWPRSGAPDATDLPADDEFDAYDNAQDTSDVEETEPAADDPSAADTPPELAEQDDERWEEALPLNGVNVGDLVLPAIPATGASTAATSPATSAATGEAASNPFEAGRNYAWMKQGS